MRSNIVPPVALAIFLLIRGWSASAERLPIRTYSAADGLGSAFVAQIAQDQAGFLWFSTRDGLSRYNGYEFVTFDSENGLTSGTALSSLESPSGRIFVITNSGLIASVMDAGGPPNAMRFTPYTIRGASPQPNIHALTSGPTGILWGGATGSVVRDLEGTPSIIRLDSLRGPDHPVVRVASLCEDRHGRVWVATNRGLYVVHPDRSVRHYSLYEHSDGDILHTVVPDGNGRIFIGHRNAGMVVLDPDSTGILPCRPGTDVILYRRAATVTTGAAIIPATATRYTIADGLTSNDVTAIVPTPPGAWIGTADGLNRYDGRSFSPITTANGLCSNVIHSLMLDRQGGLWIGSPTGAMCLPPGGFVTYLSDNPASGMAVAAIGHDGDGSVYVVSRDWWITTIAGRTVRSMRLRVPRGATSMWASQLAYHDTHGRWWALTSRGLYRFGSGRINGPPERVYTERDGLPGSQIFRLYQDSRGRYWISTRSGDPRDDGIAVLDPDLTTIRDLAGSPGLPPHRAPSAFAEDSTGALWIGMYSGGIVRWKDQRFRSYGPADGLPAGMVTDMVVDGRNRLWIGTSTHGILCIDDPSRDSLRIRRYTHLHGLTSNNVRCLVLEDADHLWAGTVRGVDMLDIRSGTFQHHTTDHGVAGDFVTAAHRDPKGTLWFGTFQGVSARRPDGTIAAGPPPILVTGIRIGGERFVVRDPGQRSVGPLTLKDDQHDLTIEFSSIALYAAVDVRYQYAMRDEGEWQETSLRQRTVSFARLAPGDYLFRVRAVGPDGTPSVHPATVTFRVLPPFWQTWWFILGGCAALASILFLIYRARVRKLRDLTRLRMRLASDLHDEIASNLSSIAMFGTLMKNGTIEPKEHLDRITALAAGSAEVVREIIWSIDPKVETVASVMDRLRDVMVTACRARGMRLTVAVADDAILHTLDLSPEQRKNLWLMLKEAMNNAITHSEGSELDVAVRLLGSEVVATVTDNGRGWTGQPRGDGRGTATMQMRARALGGTMSIEPHPPSGTHLVFRFRLEK